VQADSNVLQIDLIKKFKCVPNLYGKVRMVDVIGDENTIALGGIKKLDPSYREIRFELNYLF
jgi:predicted RNA-binding protein